MSDKAYYTNAPENISYMALPNGSADVWLRENITQGEDEAGESCWVVDEVYFRTTLTEEEVTENFDTLFANGGPVVDEETGEEVISEELTIAERMDAAEEGIVELANIVAALL